MKSGNIKHNGIKLQIDWPRISIDILSEGLDVLFESELRHCHEFVRTISDLMFLTKDDSYRDKNNILDVASDLYKNTGIDDENLKSHIIENQFRHADTNKDPKYLKEIQGRLFTRRIINVKNAELVTKDLQKKILRCRSFVTDKTAKFYFSNAQSVKDSALLQPG